MLLSAALLSPRRPITTLIRSMTKIAVTDQVIYVVHYAASGETFIRNEQYRDQRFWAQEKTDNWSGVSVKRPDGQGGPVGRVHREAISRRQARGDHRQRMPADPRVQ
jgi:hypothetical protein